MRAALPAGLFLALLASAVGTVYTQYLRRTLFVELQALEAERDALEIEWGQLRLEHSTWAAPDRIEGIARTRLGLEMPTAEKTVLVIP